jgi:hypothetical protein
MINFIHKSKDELPTLEAVEINQFFVNFYGMLCQKASDTAYHVIADAAGIPNADFYEDIDKDTVVRRILNDVVKIEF